MKPRRSGRRRERGQVLPMLAGFVLLILAAMAVSTDLSVNTHYKRQLQNITDGAALAGAKLLPASPALNDLESATAASLSVVHNAFHWSVTGSGWAQSLATSGCASAQCTVTVCAGISDGATCTATVSPGNASPFVLTVNAPPLTAAVAHYNGDAHRLEVVMHQQSGVFFARIFGTQPDQEGAQSIAYHFAPAQPLPFALVSRTVIQSGNQGETIGGNIYTDRYLSPQSNGHAGICAGLDSNGHPGYVYLGYPQQDDASPPYAADGQSSSRADPVVSGATCPAAGGQVAMTGRPVGAADCIAGLPGVLTDSTVTYDAPDDACEMNPSMPLPVVAALPNLPVYPVPVCGVLGLVLGSYAPNEYRCPVGPALVVDHQLAPGVYEVDAGLNTGGCDVTMDGTVASLTGVTFYLKGGAGLCITLPSGSKITQTPFNAGTGDPGDGRYIAVSDNVAAPSILLNSSGGGSSSGIWNVSGTIWLPTGSLTMSNKAAIEAVGQVVVGTWNDQGGYHQNAAVSYNSTLAPQETEVLQLSE